MASSVLNGMVVLETVRKAIRLPVYIAYTTITINHQQPAITRPAKQLGSLYPPVKQHNLENVAHANIKQRGSVSPKVIEAKTNSQK